MEPIERVRHGMKIFDADGEKIGTVRSAKAGDPDAVTEEGEVRGDYDGPLGFDFDPLHADSINEELRQKLIRSGYIHVNAPGLRQDFFVPADQVADVTDDEVRLTR